VPILTGSDTSLGHGVWVPLADAIDEARRKAFAGTTAREVEI
jgi:hypothetical protein